MEEKRIEWIDIAKGIGILTIVLGHTLKGTGQILRYIYIYNIPLFFLLSGMTFKRKDIKVFYFNKVKRILVPYIVFAIISIGIFFFFGEMAKDISTDGYTTSKILPNLLGALFANSRAGYMKWNTPLWFLPCLFATFFIVERFETIINKKKEKFIYRLIFIFLCMILEGIYSSLFHNIYLPFQFETAILAAGYMEIGIILKNINIYQKCKQSPILVGIIVVSGFCLGICISNYNRFCDVRKMMFGRSYLLYIISTLVVLPVILWISMIVHSSVLMYLGKHTIPVLTMHKFPIIIFQVVIPFTREILNRSDTFMGVSFGVFITVLIIVMCILAEKIINHIVPWVFNSPKTFVS